MNGPYHHKSDQSQELWMSSWHFWQFLFDAFPAEDLPECAKSCSEIEYAELNVANTSSFDPC